MAHQNGVSLIELLITITIIGIIATLAVPSYQDVIERNRLREAAQLIKSELQTLRGEALKRSAEVSVNVASGTTGTWCLGGTLAATQCDCSETDTTASDYCEVRRVAGDSFDKTSITTDSALVFNPRRGTASPNTVTITTANHSALVQTSIVGMSRICGGEIYDPC